jgi:phosphatidylglycerophosphatase A
MLVATFGGAGLAPKAPGTAGSLAALPFAVVLAHAGGGLALLIAAAAVFAIGWWAAAVVVRRVGPDPSIVVIDEVAGQFLTLAAAPLDWRYYAAGFVLFRFFDIVKPWPVGLADRRVGGGFGVMLDDILAAIYAGALLLVGGAILGR